MSTDKHPPAELDPLRREAVAWVQQLLSGHATPDDAAAIKRWCAQSPAHAVAFAEASRVWSDLKPAGELLHRDDVLVSLAEIAAKRRLSRRAFVGGGFAAAAAASYAVVYPPLGLWPSISEMTADYRTATGEQRHIKLANEISVQLNTQTSIVLRRQDPDTDRIELIAGEASFTSSPQSQRTLMVLAAGGATIGAKTRFDVHHLKTGSRRSVCVTCFDGTIRVERGSETTNLGPGEQLLYDDRGLGRAAAVDPEIMSAWQRGIVVFRATPLVEVVEEINRYRSGKIILLNAKLGQKPVSGRFRINQMDEILSRLEQAFDVKIRTLPGSIVLLS